MLGTGGGGLAGLPPGSAGSSAGMHSLGGVPSPLGGMPSPLGGAMLSPMAGGMSPLGGAAGSATPLTMVAPSNAFGGEGARYPWYRVAFVGGVLLRQGPSVEAPKTGETLCQNATFAAAEELPGADGRVYLRLADGRGWAFDDTALFPHDPAVVRGYWQPIGPAPSQQDRT
eukprot:gnl/TRDRNA2_/TRDRNA2_194646_c0_seq1.p1 gnl/TRDRNA2_/TRDRNA2_194646_c0~~gnl/TRDRNA2_/TRDRNA2_194646_c0_seq1.p1  ORF type:complete len:185 (+),score=28.18 gnl/TRDRNA2_/TRDRNA2_194646_c0_seq1:43-555(+)